MSSVSNITSEIKCRIGRPIYYKEEKFMKNYEFVIQTKKGEPNKWVSLKSEELLKEVKVYISQKVAGPRKKDENPEQLHFLKIGEAVWIRNKSILPVVFIGEEEEEFIEKVRVNSILYNTSDKVLTLGVTYLDQNSSPIIHTKKGKAEEWTGELNVESVEFGGLTKFSEALNYE